MVGAWAVMSACATAEPSIAATTGTPRPWTFQFAMAGLLARESSLSTVFPRTSGLSDMSGRWLVAYSCGGSAGIAFTHRLPS